MQGTSQRLMRAIAPVMIATSTQASPSGGDAGHCAAIADLKKAYLRCERAAQSGALAAGEIARCSQVYYELKDAAFDGEFARIRAWYETVLAVAPERTLGALRPPSQTGDCR